MRYDTFSKEVDEIPKSKWPNTQVNTQVSTPSTCFYLDIVLENSRGSDMWRQLTAGHELSGVLHLYHITHYHRIVYPSQHNETSLTLHKATRLVALVKVSSASVELVFSQVKLVCETTGVSLLEQTLQVRLFERCNIYPSDIE